MTHKWGFMPVSVFVLVMVGSFALGAMVGRIVDTPVAVAEVGTTAPAGRVLDIADVTFDSGISREYRLQVIAFDDGFPYTVRVGKETFDYYRENLGSDWPRE